MWNFGLPYKLKHLIDLVAQRNYLFAYDGEQYGRLLNVEVPTKYGLATELIACLRKYAAHSQVDPLAAEPSCPHCRRRHLAKGTIQHRSSGHVLVDLSL